MKIFQYKSYADYISFQKKWFANKVGKITYVRENTIQEICNHMKENFDDVNSILCHGTRDGTEQKFFKKRFPDAEVVGSEIGDGAEQRFEMTVQHDFNQPKEEWIEHFDVVYSNSYDHSITPVETLGVWADQLTPNGRIYLEYAGPSRWNSSESDPLAADFDEVRQFIADADLTLFDTIEKNVYYGGKVFVCGK